jgi:CheY-like chemotaxis protein
LAIADFDVTNSVANGRGRVFGPCGPAPAQALKRRVADYVTKPFSIPQLTARVRACLARIQPL